MVALQLSPIVRISVIVADHDRVSNMASSPTGTQRTGLRNSCLAHCAKHILTCLTGCRMSGASVTVSTKVAAPGEPTTLSKRISIGTDGRMFSDGSGCRMAEGIARTVSAPDTQTLARVIGNLGSENAIALGVSEHSECHVVTARALKQMNGRALNGMPVIARTREFLDALAQI